MSRRTLRVAAGVVSLTVGVAVTCLPAEDSALAAPGRRADAASPPARGSEEGRRLVWARPRPGGPVEVTGTKAGPWLARAQREVGRIGARLDALRAARVHVAWTRLAWLDGRVEVTALADSGLYGDVGLLAVRDLYAKRPSAGSGVQQISGLGPAAPFPWRVRVLLGRPGGGRVIYVPAGAAPPPRGPRAVPARPTAAENAGSGGGRCPNRPRPGALAPPGTPQGISRVPAPAPTAGRSDVQ